MFLSDVEKAVNEARATINNANLCVGQMARLCAGRLRESGVSGYVLEKLKRELKNYNMHTGIWKDS